MPLPLTRTPRVSRAQCRQFVWIAVIYAVAGAVLAAAPKMTRPDGVPAQAGQPAQDERVAASFVLARGRVPAPAEADAWAASATSAFSELMARHDAATGCRPC